jgi:hypothetical protein
LYPFTERPRPRWVDALERPLGLDGGMDVGGVECAGWVVPVPVGRMWVPMGWTGEDEDGESEENEEEEESEEEEEGIEEGELVMGYCKLLKGEYVPPYEACFQGF